MNKKKILLIVLGIISGLLIILISFFFISLGPTSKSNESVVFTIQSGESKNVILDNLKDANLIKSKYSTLVYMYLTGKKNIQAGSYDLTRDMGAKKIISAITSGDIIDDKRPSVKITFKEGITLEEYLELLAENTDLEYDTIIKEINDQEFLKSLIADYSFLSNDILDTDLYYGLEGYLFPETYYIYVDTTLKEAIKRILNETSAKLNSIKDELDNSSYSIHEILTIASIIEKEANTYEDRCKVAQVIYTRLNRNMSLGMDTTTYYGAGKKLGESITANLNDVNPYNTRLVSFIGLPAGPICNPSLESIKAALNPSDTNYVYFFAESNGTMHFTASKDEFENFKIIYKW